MACCHLRRVGDDLLVCHVELFGKDGRLLEDGDGFEGFRGLGLGLQSQLHDCLKLWLVDHRHAATEKFVEQHIEDFGLAHGHALRPVQIAIIDRIRGVAKLIQKFAKVHAAIIKGGDNAEGGLEFRKSDGALN